MPRVSVVIPTYNSARYLGAAIDSVFAQTFHDFEVVVVDDGSTDDTESMMSRRFQSVPYVRQPNLGVAKARNTGIEQTSGRYVAFLDADDTWLPAKLERQMTALADAPANRASYGSFIVCSETLTPLTVQRSLQRGRALEDLLLRGNVIGSPGTVLCERSLFSIVGGFDPTLSQCADWDMWIRLATQTEFAYLNEPLVNYRQHGASMSRRPELLERDSLRLLTKGFNLPAVPASLWAQRRRAFARNYMVLAGTYFYAGRYRDFLRCMLRALVLDPRQLEYLGALPARLLRRWRHGVRPVGQWQ